MTDFSLASGQTSWGLDDEKADFLRSEVTSLLKNSSPNLTKEKRQSVMNLQMLDDILMLPADKDRATVILDKTEYEDKVVLILGDDKTYEQLSQDHTSK